MKIEKLIEELQRVLDKEGNIEVTCTATSLPDNERDPVWESTVEELIVINGGFFKKRVRLYM